MVTYLPRSAWKARASRGPVALTSAAVEGEALHWPGMAKPINADGDIGARRIASALRGWQNYHMDDRGWSDIAYQVAVDQAGRAWTLRGLNIRSGANGDADVNRRFGAFLLIVAPGEHPSPAMIMTTRDVIADFRKRYPKARAKPYGHRDVRPEGTDCPGPLAYAAIQAGTFTPTSKPTPPAPAKDWFDMATKEDLDEVLEKWTVSREHWDSQAWAYLATAIAASTKAMNGETVTQAQIDAGLAAGRNALNLLEDSFD